MCPEICIKIQIRQNFGIATKNHSGLGNCRNSIYQTKHYIFTQLQAHVRCEEMELSTCASLGGKGHTQHFPKVGFLTTVLSLPN